MNLYLCFPLISGTILITLALVVLIPQGLWLYLAGLILGVMAVTFSIFCMLGNE
jgi:hypothetical protein